MKICTAEMKGLPGMSVEDRVYFFNRRTKCCVELISMFHLTRDS